MVTLSDFTRVNFGVWCYKDYTFQALRSFGMRGTHAEKLNSDVLIIGSEIIKVTDAKEALTMINKREKQNDTN